MSILAISFSREVFQRNVITEPEELNIGDLKFTGGRSYVFEVYVREIANLGNDSPLCIWSCIDAFCFPILVEKIEEVDNKDPGHGSPSQLITGYSQADIDVSGGTSDGFGLILPNSLNKSQFLEFRVVLRSDLVIDVEQGLPVDGNHVDGLLPSGNGFPGSSFESWFWMGEREN